MDDWESLKAHLPRICRSARIAGERVEFRTFLVGTHWPAERGDSDRAIARRYFNTEVGRYLEAVWTHRSVDFRRPEVRFHLEPMSGRVRLEIASVFVAGRYRKLSRDLPQSRWPCRDCRGRGCERCSGSGVRYRETVEGFLAAPLVERAGGEGSRIHCAGREDIDARMLGRGRPFVLEIRGPRRRTLSFEGVASEVTRISSGRVEVTDLRLADRGAAPLLKGLRLDKTYRALVEVEGDRCDPRRLQRLDGVAIRQRTPARVAHRRRDLERIRVVRSVSFEQRSATELVLRIRAEAGTYIKELVSGDGGRTSPSVAEILGRACVCTRLDVLEVHGPDPEAGGPAAASAWVSGESEI